MVLYEAMSKGIPIISFDRGCISCQVGRGGHVLASESEFGQAALAILENYIQFPEQLLTQRAAAQLEFKNDREQARALFSSLFSTIPLVITPTMSFRE